MPNVNSKKVHIGDYLFFLLLDDKLCKDNTVSSYSCMTAPGEVLSSTHYMVFELQHKCTFILTKEHTSKYLTYIQVYIYTYHVICDAILPNVCSHFSIGQAFLYDKSLEFIQSLHLIVRKVQVNL